MVLWNSIYSLSVLSHLYGCITYVLNVLPNVIRLQEKYLNVQTETVSTIYIIEKKDKAFDILQAVTINNKFDHAFLDIWDTDMAIVYCYIHHAVRLFLAQQN